MPKKSIPSKHCWHTVKQIPKRSFLEKLEDIQKGMACGVCEELCNDLEPLKDCPVTSIKNLKFCQKCRILLNDNGKKILFNHLDLNS